MPRWMTLVIPKTHPFQRAPHASFLQAETAALLSRLTVAWGLRVSPRSESLGAGRWILRATSEIRPLGSGVSDIPRHECLSISIRLLRLLVEKATVERTPVGRRYCEWKGDERRSTNGGLHR